MISPNLSSVTSCMTMSDLTGLSEIADEPLPVPRFTVWSTVKCDSSNLEQFDLAGMLPLAEGTGIAMHCASMFFMLETKGQGNSEKC